MLAHYVAGHQRLLRPGQHPSDEAARRAQRIGITLREGETWVRPHLRGGVTDGSELVFSWQTPAHLLRVVRD